LVTKIEEQLLGKTAREQLKLQKIQKQKKRRKRRTRAKLESPSGTDQ
jgi:hypothetical protein